MFVLLKSTTIYKTSSICHTTSLPLKETLNSPIISERLLYYKFNSELTICLRSIHFWPSYLSPSPLSITLPRFCVHSKQHKRLISLSVILTWCHSFIFTPYFTSDSPLIPLHLSEHPVKFYRPKIRL